MDKYICEWKTLVMLRFAELALKVLYGNATILNFSWTDYDIWGSVEITKLQSDGRCLQSTDKFHFKEIPLSICERGGVRTDTKIYFEVGYTHKTLCFAALCNDGKEVRVWNVTDAYGFCGTSENDRTPWVAEGDVDKLIYEI